MYKFKKNRNQILFIPDLNNLIELYKIYILVYKYNTCNKLHNRHEKCFCHYLK